MKTGTLNGVPVIICQEERKNRGSFRGRKVGLVLYYVETISTESGERLSLEGLPSLKDYDCVIERDFIRGKGIVDLLVEKGVLKIS